MSQLRIPDESERRPAQPLPEEQAGTLRALLDRTLLTWRLFWDGRVSFLAKIIPLLALAYIVSPIDILPAALLGPLGFLDDMGAIGVMLVALGLFIQMSPPDVVREHLREMGASLDRFIKPGEDVVEGDARVIED